VRAHHRHPEGRHVRYALADPALAHALADLADLADLVLMVDQGVTCPPSRNRQQVN
jgi:hypothetical protein